MEHLGLAIAATRTSALCSPSLSPEQSDSAVSWYPELAGMGARGAGEMCPLWLPDPLPVPPAVVSVRPKAHSRPSRMSCYVEVAGDGLPSETKKTGKQIGSSELLWNEILTL